jgi:hypothetical protein
MSATEVLERLGSAQSAHEDAPIEYHDPYGLAKVPVLFAFLAQRVVGESRRLLGKVTIFCDDGRLKACVKDSQNHAVLFVTLDSLEDAWECLDAALASPGADWRRTRGWKKN